jgi:[ribosomal protein S18]-alanine N-acetyltransferase
VSDSITVVPMTAAHIKALMPYEREMFEGEAWSADSYRAELADVRHRRYVVVEGPSGELLGWAGVLVVAETAEILTVGVIPAARRRGLARQLLAVLYAEAIARGATELFLEVRIDNHSAQSLYAAEGFVDLGRRRGYYGNGTIDAVVMRRAL